MAKKWYVLHTYSGYENKVKSNLEQRIEVMGLENNVFGIEIPTEMVTEIKDNQKKEVERKLFPSYVLVKMIMTDDSWYVVRNIRGVTGFVGPGSKPIPLTEAEIARFGVETRATEVNYAVGDSVMVSGGYMEGFVGVVDSIDLDKGLVRVTVSMMGKEVPVELELTQVQTVG